MMMTPIDASSPWTGVSGNRSISRPARTTPNSTWTTPAVTPIPSASLYPSHALSASDIPGVANSAPRSETAPTTITISPAAGPLIVSSELLRSEHITPPMTAVQMPAIGGNPLALAIARQSGIAIRNTRNPAIASNRMFPKNPAASGGTAGAAAGGWESAAIRAVLAVRGRNADGNATAVPRFGAASSGRIVRKSAGNRTRPAAGWLVTGRGGSRPTTPTC